MTIADIQKHPLFKALGSDQLRKFVEEMCANGFDKVGAAKEAWGGKDSSATTQANRAVKHPAVKRLLALFQGRLTREEHLIALTTRAQMADDDSVAFKYLELIAKIEGWLTKPAENPEAPKDPDAAGENIYELVEEMEREAKK